MIDCNTTPTFHTQLSKTLREVIKKAVTEFRSSSSPIPDEGSNNGVIEAVPVSFKAPENCQALSSRKRVSTLVVGETLISFKLPENFTVDDTDFDKLLEEDGEMGPNGVKIVRKFSFFERLEGWKMERRQRVNGRFDMYYYHQQSKRMFRSITEVVNFFMYEVYPEKPQRSAGKEKIGEDGLSDNKCVNQKGITPLKRKMNEKKCADFGRDEISSRSSSRERVNFVDENHKETVEKFLANAYDNLLNWSDHQNDTSFSSFNCNGESGSPDDHQNDTPNESVEKLLAEAYNNLLSYPNYSNDEAKIPKGKEKRRSIEKPKRKKVKNLTPNPTSSSNSPCEVDAIPTKQTENEREKEQKREKEEKKEIKIEETANLQIPKAMEVEEKSSSATVGHRRFNIREVDGRIIFSDVVESDQNYAGGGGGGSSSAMDECDLLKHIPQSPDMFELAFFLANNRNGGFM